MSLKVEDWKTVLDQPKNAGLKAFGGTGISQTLRNYADAEAKFQQSKTLSKAADRERALRAVVTTCEEVIRKHQKVYTTACNYLTTVKQSAAHHLPEVTEELNEIRETERLKHQAENAREFVKDTCAELRHELADARDINQIHTVWKGFSDRLSHAAETAPNLKTVANQVKAFKKQQSPNSGIDGVKGDYLLVLKAVEKAVGKI